MDNLPRTKCSKLISVKSPDESASRTNYIEASYLMPPQLIALHERLGPRDSDVMALLPLDHQHQLKNLSVSVVGRVQFTSTEPSPGV